MENRKGLLIGLAALVGVCMLAVIGGVAFWLGSPLFIDREVSEALPGSEATQEAPGSEADAVATGEAMPDTEMDEEMPAEEIQIIKEGTFMAASSSYESSGVAKIIQLADGSYVLRFEDFQVTNGPQLHVFVSGAAEPANRSDVMTAPSLDLGRLKGNIGAQNYELPADLDIANIRSVSVYCVPFSVLFAQATFQ